MATTDEVIEPVVLPNTESQVPVQETAIQKEPENQEPRSQQRGYERDKYLPDAYFNENLLQSDNTGTRKYKNLMQGLKNIIVSTASEVVGCSLTNLQIARYHPTENPDLMPGQLASYYEDLNGDYNQLFLKTPNPSIAFIYKSLGCPYSLQPVQDAQRVEEPEVPALKTEGWILWSTIQMLLGPDEHASFLTEAVRRWDVIDPETGKIFPKTLPRGCLPATPDQRMSDWYEGVSKRLTEEAEEDAQLRERQRAMEKHAIENSRTSVRLDDEEDSVDSRGPALAYFRNPLYRHVDGRPSIIRESSKRPPLSPRRSLVDKGKGAAATVGTVSRNVTSPHPWDGNGNRRRRSVPENRYHHPSEPAPPGVPFDHRLSAPGQPQPSPRQRRDHHRGGSSAGDDDGRASAHTSQSHLRPQREDREHVLRHSRSHDPWPIQREHDDYFNRGDPSSTHHRGSSYEDMPPAIGPSFAPSPGLPFAAQVARQYPDNRAPRRATSRHGDVRPYSPVDRRARFDDIETNSPLRKRSRSRYDDRVPYNDRPPYDERQRYDDRIGSDEHARHHHHHAPHDDRQRQHDRHDARTRYDEQRDADERPRYDDRGPPEDRRRYEGPRDRYDGSPDPRRFSGGYNRSASRRSRGSDIESAYSGPEDQDRRVNRNKTRPISGVDGRRYVDQSPWQSQGQQ